ncbi:MAG TPA: alpha/beta hydrolase [Dehalococcoidia bacterium]
MEAQVNGISLYYETEGTGPPLLLLHGGPGLDHTVYRPWLSPLAKAVTLVYLDLRGQGRSDRADPTTYTLEQVARDVEEFRRAMGWSRFSLLGHSYGGFVALQYAVDHSDRLNHLVLVGTAASADIADDLAASLTEYGSPSVLEAVEAGARATTEEAFRLAAEGQLPFHFSRLDGPYQRFREQLAAVRYSPEFAGWWNEHDFPAYNLRARLGEITCPTLVIRGAEDRVAGMERAVELARGIPQATLVVIGEAGHWPMVEQQEEFTRVVGDFLRLR